jgi:serine/threonine-protein kinase
MVDSQPKQSSETLKEIKLPGPDPLIGVRLDGRFLIESALGSGGMSVVYKGKHESVDRTVAIKTLKLDLCSEPVLVSRFEREIKSLSRLNHPNIVTVFDCVISPQGQPYIIMDYVNGESLEDSLSRGPMSAARAVKLVIQVCNALEHAHRHGVIHRDLKPANIMLQKGEPLNEVKVVDFGLAKLAEDTQKLTKSDELWGSLPYMSPEQCSSNENIEIDTRSDIYSLGAVLFQMLTGKDPFYGLDLMETIRHHQSEDPPFFKEVAPQLKFPPALEGVVRKALNKDKEDRFQSMREFKEAIEFAAAPLLKEEEQNRSLASTSARPPVSSKPRSTRDFTAPAKRKKKSNIVKIVGITSGISILCTIALSYCMIVLFKGSFVGMGNSLKTTAASAGTTQTSNPVAPVTPPKVPAPKVPSPEVLSPTAVKIPLHHAPLVVRSVGIGGSSESGSTNSSSKIHAFRTLESHKIPKVVKHESSVKSPAQVKPHNLESRWSALELQRSK